MTILPMKCIYWAIPNLLAGRPGPDEINSNLEELQRAGFGAILSLHSGGVNSANIRQHGFAHELLPLPNSVPPSIEDFRTYQLLLPRALSFIEQHVTTGISTLVHCHASKDRTGVVLVCYLCTHEQTSPSEAVRRLRAVKPTLLSAEGYEALAYRLLDSKRNSYAA